jgi:FAD/FMN-containing dehydrogenase
MGTKPRRAAAPGATRRSVLKAGAAVALDCVLPHSARAEPVVLNDASGLNPTPVFRHWIVEPNAQADLVARLRQELKAAAAERRPVSLSAARHSMGGQSLPRDGLAITVNSARCEVDRAAKTFRVDAGTRWHHVIAAVDRIGFSPAVMQSNHDFGVAATFSVNAHGWPVPYGPFGSTVRALSLMLADGTIVRCSRTENAELFRLAMGGYGLLGLILELEAEMVPNRLLRPTYSVIPSGQFAQRFVAAIEENPLVGMAYGRLSVARQGFLEEALICTYRPTGSSRNLPPADTGGFMSGVSRRVYRAQVGSEAAKRWRWRLESQLNPRVTSGIATRNALMNEPVANLAPYDDTRTDILHEYFVPPERFGAFIGACQEVIPRAGIEFLNVTLRFVDADPDSVLAFAPTRRIAAVMSFSQELKPAAELAMQRMTEALIERVVAIGGSFYLPYRLHARRDQVEKAYPNLARFTARKHHYDPQLLFRNAMWPAYFAI